MKKHIVSVVITAFVMAFLFTAHAYSSEQKLVAKVGDKGITRFEFIEALKSFKPPSLYHDVSQEKMHQFEKEAIKELIDIELLHKEAQKRGVKVSRDTIKEVIEANIQRLGSKKNMERMLASKGQSLDSFKEEIKKHQMVITLLHDMKKDAEYEEEELKRYYQENRSKFKRPESRRLYNIVIKVEAGVPDDEWEKRRLEAEEILNKLKSGEDFGEIAYKYSEDDYKVKAGDYGFVHKGQLEKEIEDTAFALEEGELSGVIRSIYGFHIIKGGERKPAEIMSYDEIKGKTKMELSKERFEENKKELLDRLGEVYPVEIYINMEE
jgi:parvulin-like peptidyl-prolyl isomerase